MKRFGQHIFQTITVTMLFVGSLLPGFSNQLNKLPSLVNHYKHHVEEHGDITISTFIALHYNENSSHRSEENHQDLPFFQMSTTSLVAVSHEFEMVHPVLPTINAFEIGYYKPNHYSFQDCGSIFQPPRVG